MRYAIATEAVHLQKPKKDLTMKTGISWALTLFVCFVFIQSLFFKFTGSQETVIIFNTIADWMQNNFLQPIAASFREYGGWTVGLTELFASLLLLIPRTRILGALLGFGVISGAIFFHLFTPLGVDRVVDNAGNTDGGILFYMACGVWLSCVALVAIEGGSRKASK